MILNPPNTRDSIYTPTNTRSAEADLRAAAAALQPLVENYEHYLFCSNWEHTGQMAIWTTTGQTWQSNVVCSSLHSVMQSYLSTTTFSYMNPICTTWTSATAFWESIGWRDRGQNLNVLNQHTCQFCEYRRTPMPSMLRQFSTGQLQQMNMQPLSVEEVIRQWAWTNNPDVSSLDETDLLTDLRWTHVCVFIIIIIRSWSWYISYRIDYRSLSRSNN